MGRARLLLLACALLGCTATPRSGEVAAFPAGVDPDLDVLILVDDSTSAATAQALAASVPDLLAALAARPGGLPNVHIGVATQDLGTTGALDPAHAAPALGSGAGACAGAGDAGALRVPAAAGVSGTYLSDAADGSGGRARNYPGDLGQTVGAMITSVGATGCGFEQTLRAIPTALGAAVNAGFRRPSAALAVIVLSDEDDCSVRDPAIFDLSAPGRGPLDSFRCTRAGLTCAEPLDVAGAKSACAPAEGPGDLVAVSDLAAALRAFAPSPLRLAVAAIVAPPTPVVVEPGAANALVLAPSCTYPTSDGMGFADPAVRTAAWAAALGGATYPICTSDDAATAAAIGAQLRAVVDGDPCVAGGLADPQRPACTADEDGAPLPACPGGDPCFALVPDAAACPDTPTHLRVAITRSAAAAPNAAIHVTCELP